MLDENDPEYVRPTEASLASFDDLTISSADLQSEEMARREVFDRAIAKRRALEVSLRNEAQLAQLREHDAKIRDGVIPPSTPTPTAMPSERHAEIAKEAVARHMEIPEGVDLRDAGHPGDPSPYVRGPLAPEVAPLPTDPVLDQPKTIEPLSPETQKEMQAGEKAEEAKQPVPTSDGFGSTTSAPPPPPPAPAPTVIDPTKV